MRVMLRKLHRWVGLLIGLWIVLLSLSGSALVYRDALENWQFRDLRVITPAPPALPMQELARIASEARPDKRTVRVRLPSAEGVAAEFLMISPGARNLKTAEQISVYVDPYRGHVIGQREHTQGWIWWVQDFHYALWSGITGLRLNGFVALALVLMVVSGLFVWWPGLRWRSLLLSLRIRRHASRQVVWRDLHVLLGVVSAALLCFIALTPLYYNFTPTVTRLIEVAAGSRRPPPEVDVLEGAPSATIDELLIAAQLAVPDADLHELRLSARGPGVPSSSVSFRSPNQYVPMGNVVFLHPQSAEVVRIDHHNELPLTERLFASMAPWHFGSFGGRLTQGLWFATGLAPLILLVSGVVVWNGRRRSRRAKVPVSGNVRAVGARSP